MQLSIEQVQEFLYREARYLDDKQWNDWLDLYAPDAVFWMPAWDDDDKLTQDPQNEVSRILSELDVVVQIGRAHV